MANSRTAELLDALSAYREARRTFLRVLGTEDSNRDPFAEFSERLVAIVLDGSLANSRVQKGFDLTTPTGDRVQVRCLANPRDQWVNEHVVDFRGECDRYALVVFESFEPCAALIFSRHSLAAVCSALGKRHPDQDRCLQLTRRNYTDLVRNRSRFAELGVETHDLSQGVRR